MLAAKVKSFIHLDRVKNKSNLADGPSCLDFSLMIALNAKKVDAKVDALNGPDALAMPPKWKG